MEKMMSPLLLPLLATLLACVSGQQDYGNGYFQYTNVKGPKEFQFGYNRGNAYHHRSHHEKHKDHTFQAKVNWSDAKGGQGEHYFEYNHGDKHTSYKEPQSYKPPSYAPKPYAPLPYKPPSYASKPYAPLPYEPKPFATLPYEPKPYAPKPYFPKSYSPEESYAPKPYAPKPYRPHALPFEPLFK